MTLLRPCPCASCVYVCTYLYPCAFICVYLCLSMSVSLCMPGYVCVSLMSHKVIISTDVLLSALNLNVQAKVATAILMHICSKFFLEINFTG